MSHACRMHASSTNLHFLLGMLLLSIHVSVDGFSLEGLGGLARQWLIDVATLVMEPYICSDFESRTCCRSGPFRLSYFNVGATSTENYL